MDTYFKIIKKNNIFGKKGYIKTSYYEFINKNYKINLITPRGKNYKK